MGRPGPASHRASTESSQRRARFYGQSRLTPDAQIEARGTGVSRLNASLLILAVSICTDLLRTFTNWSTSISSAAGLVSTRTVIDAFVTRANYRIGQKPYFAPSSVWLGGGMASRTALPYPVSSKSSA
jgi:hypothetical protein